MSKVIWTDDERAMAEAIKKRYGRDYVTLSEVRELLSAFERAKNTPEPQMSEVECLLVNDLMDRDGNIYTGPTVRATFKVPEDFEERLKRDGKVILGKPVSMESVESRKPYPAVIPPLVRGWGEPIIKPMLKHGFAGAERLEELERKQTATRQWDGMTEPERELEVSVWGLEYVGQRYNLTADDLKAYQRYSSNPLADYVNPSNNPWMTGYHTSQTAAITERVSSQALTPEKISEWCGWRTSEQTARDSVSSGVTPGVNDDPTTVNFPRAHMATSRALSSDGESISRRLNIDVDLNEAELSVRLRSILAPALEELIRSIADGLNSTQPDNVSYTIPAVKE